MEKVKTLWCATAFVTVILLLLALALPASASQSEGEFSKSKDGISVAVMPGKDADGQTSLNFTVSDNCGYADTFLLELQIKDSDDYVFKLSGTRDGVSPVGESSFSVKPGKGQTSSFALLALRKQLEEEPAINNSGCRGASFALPVIICAALGAVLILSRKDGKKALALLLCVAALGSALTYAAPCLATDEINPRQRKMSFEFSADVDGAVRTIVCDLTYVYDFKEDVTMKTTGMDKFEITYYWGPHGAQAVDASFYKAIAEAGFTSVPLEMCSYEQNTAALGLMREYGLTCTAVWDSRVDNLINTLNDSVSDEQIDAVTREVVDSYKDYADVIKGWWMADEPSAGRFAVLARVKASFARTDPGRTVMINLFPTYANETQLGTSTYEDYLDQYIKTVKPDYLSYDHYHFLVSSARTGFFTNLEAVRKAGLDAGLDQMAILLLTRHLSYGDLSYEQLCWEVNMSLAYGMKRISYFTFILDQGLLDQGWKNACMNYKGEIYPHYYDVQKISKWLSPLGNELFGKTSTAVFHIAPTKEAGTRVYSSYGDLGEVEGTGFVAGFFDDSSFMLVNKAYYAEAGTKSLTFVDVTECLEYFDTADSEWKSASVCPAISRDAQGRYVLTLSAGEGILLRVAK